MTNDKLGISAVALAAFLFAACVSAADTKSIDVPPGDLTVALETLARQSGVEFVYEMSQLRGLRTKGVHGQLTPEDAVTKLLEGTKLTVTTHASGAVLISAPTASSAADTSTGHGNSPTSAMHLAQAKGSAGSEGSQSASTPGEGDTKVEEIVVTAQKRVERLHDVPVPVTAVSAETLVINNQRRLQDYYSTIPGLNLTLGARSETNLAIRGVTAYAGNPTVGIMVDEVPYGTATEAAGGYIVPDIDPSDLVRIEVLRGPQGTLYGANSMGGLLKYVTIDPSTEGFSGRAQAGMTSVQHGSDLGYSLRGVVNVPLSETLAMRLSGFTRRESGYIDNPITGRDDLNALEARGGRFAALWKPSDRLSLKLSALFQRSEREGAPNINIDPAVSGLEQTNLRDTGIGVGDFQAYSATFNADLGAGVELTSITGYNINKIYNVVDFSPSIFGVLSQALFQVSGAAIYEHKKTRKFTQEIRFAGSAGERIEWLGGGFYARETSPAFGDFFAIDAVTGDVRGTWYVVNAPTSYEEYAAFANVTFKISDRFDVQVGARQGYMRQLIDDSFLSGAFNALIGAPDPLVTPGKRSEDHAFTYLFTPRYRISQDLMVYARLASGYRGGGSNGIIPGVPSAFDPDQTYNYEIGIKGDLLGPALSVDASVYYIDWRKLQINVTDPVTHNSYTDNAGAAKSQGVELSLTSRPREGLSVTGWFAWNDATFTDFPASSPIVAANGDRLPFSSRVSGYASIDQAFPVAANVTGYVGGAVRYVGDRIGQLGQFPVRQEFPAYTQVDLRAGATFGSWTANLFLNNVADKRGMLSGGIGMVPENAFTYIQPRTVGLSLSKDF